MSSKKNLHPSSQSLESSLHSPYDDTLSEDVPIADHNMADDSSYTQPISSPLITQYIRYSWYNRKTYEPYIIPHHEYNDESYYSSVNHPNPFAPASNISSNLSSYASSQNPSHASPNPSSIHASESSIRSVRAANVQHIPRSFSSLTPSHPSTSHTGLTHATKKSSYIVPDFTPNLPSDLINKSATPATMPNHPTPHIPPDKNYDVTGQLSADCITFNQELLQNAQHLSSEVTINDSDNLFVGQILPPLYYSLNDPIDPTLIQPNLHVIGSLPLATTHEPRKQSATTSIQKQVLDRLVKQLSRDIYDGKRRWYEEQGLLAQGGMSNIYNYQDHHLLRTIVMKCPKKRGSSVKHRLLFIKEALVTGQLDHPNIPTIYDLWVNEQQDVCFTMKKVQGQTFAKKVYQTLQDQGRTREALEPLIHVLIKVCDALSFAHSNGVYHRDIKPDNIMIGNHGEVMLMDWGCALVKVTDAENQPLHFPEGLLEATADQTKTTVGTISYMSPEQARGEHQRLGPCSDVYLMGGLLYFLLTGHAPRPRQKDALYHLKLAQVGYIIPPHIKVPYTKLPPKLCSIAKKALHPDPQQRYATIEEFQTALKQAIKEGWWFRTIYVPKGTVLFEEGDEAQAAYMILQGTCEAYSVKQGVEHSLSYMQSGQVFGETAILSEAPRSASVRVLEDLTALEVTREAFQQELTEGSWLQIFVKTLAKRFKKMSYENMNQGKTDK